MKKILLSLFLLLSLAVTAAAAGTDVLTNASLNGGTAKQDNQYKAITPYVGVSGATYAGKLAFVKESNATCIQLNSKASTGADLVTTVSGGIVKSVKFNWSTKATAGRGVTIYGQNTAYTSGDKGKGTNIGSATTSVGGSSEVDLSEKPYKYIAIGTSANKVVYIESIEITWVAEGPVDVTPNFKNYKTTFTPGEDQYVTVEVAEPADFIEKAGELSYSTQNTEALEVDNELKTIKILKPVTDATVTVGWNASDNYNAGTATFKVTVDKAPAGLSFASATDELFTDNESPAFVELINPNKLDVAYSSSNEDVAAVIDGELMLGDPGVTTITATTEGNEIYAAGEASYTLTVVQAGLPGTPAFSFENDGYYKINESLIITPAAEGDEIYYKVGDGEYKLYTAPISFDAAEVYTVSAYAKNDNGQSTPTEISFLIEMLEYTGKFKDVEGELVLGDTRELDVELEGAKIADFNVTFIPETGILLPIPATQNKYYIVGAGDVTFTATAKVDADLYDGAITKTYTVKPKMEKSEADATLVFDFSDVTNIGYTESDFTNDNNTTALVLTGKVVDRNDGAVLSFSKNDASTNTRILNTTKKLILYRAPSDGKSGGSFTITGKNITKVELLEDGGSGQKAQLTPSVGEMGEIDANNVYTWTSNGEDKVEFVNKSTTDQARIHTITVYCTAVTEVAKEFKTYELTLAGSDYEIGEAMPHVVLPEGCTASVTYLVDDVEEPAYATKHFSEAPVKIIAHTPASGDYLPSVKEFPVITAKDYELADILAIHYSTESTPIHYTTVAYSAPKSEDGGVHRYEFTDIDVKGYDGVDGKTYGHVFFSFTPAPAEAAALAPRREAAEDDWTSFNANTDIYSAATHLTEAGENTPLVRHRAGTLGDAMPAVFRVQSAAETGKMYNFTVNLDKNGTSTVTATQSQTQTGVESVGVDADGEAEYYTLQGVRVAKPAAGIYLRRQGGTVSKVLVK